VVSDAPWHRGRFVVAVTTLIQIKEIAGFPRHRIELPHTKYHPPNLYRFAVELHSRA
jgi:hypothetical protein